MRGKDPPKYLEGARNCKVNPVARACDSLILGMVIVCTVDIMTSEYKWLLSICLNHYHHCWILSLRTVMFLLLCMILSSAFFVLLVFCLYIHEYSVFLLPGYSLLNMKGVQTISVYSCWVAYKKCLCKCIATPTHHGPVVSWHDHADQWQRIAEANAQ